MTDWAKCLKCGTYDSFTGDKPTKFMCRDCKKIWEMC